MKNRVSLRPDRGPWEMKREPLLTSLLAETVDPFQHVTEITSSVNGRIVGYWIDAEFDGHSPNAKLVVASPKMREAANDAATLLSTLVHRLTNDGDTNGAQLASSAHEMLMNAIQDIAIR